MQPRSATAAHIFLPHRLERTVARAGAASITPSVTTEARAAAGPGPRRRGVPVLVAYFAERYARNLGKAIRHVEKTRLELL